MNAILLRINLFPHAKIDKFVQVSLDILTNYFFILIDRRVIVLIGGLDASFFLEMLVLLFGLLRGSVVLFKDPFLDPAHRNILSFIASHHLKLINKKKLFDLSFVLVGNQLD